MKKNIGIKIIAALGIGYILFSTFKKKTAIAGSVYQPQSNAPTGTTQVYSNIGTKVYDQNLQVIYTFDQSNIGMTQTGTFKSNMYSVVLGSDFANGVSGFVYITDVNVI
jgi:hypothetical protein